MHLQSYGSEELPRPQLRASLLVLLVPGRHPPDPAYFAAPPPDKPLLPLALFPYDTNSHWSFHVGLRICLTSALLEGRNHAVFLQLAQNNRSLS